MIKGFSLFSDQIVRINIIAVLTVRRKMAKLKYLIILMTCGYSFCSPWTWECKQNVCTKALHQQGQNQMGLSECLLSCDPTTLLWPLPRNCSLGKNSSLELVITTINVYDFC